RPGSPRSHGCGGRPPQYDPRPFAVSDDTLSDLLRTVRLTGAVFFDVDAAAPWVAMQPPGRTIAGSVLPGVQHLISYHAVVSGGCSGALAGGEPVRLEAGDAIVLPHGDSHVMSSAPELPATIDLGVYRRPAAGLPVSVHIEGAGPRTHLV